ncbi:MAG: propionyl-CoA synthetase [Calditrichaeota bacterium]|nr:propionyl-CoA synthetase [Calditrichota bacterium]
MGYKEVYGRWQADPEAFWMEAAQAIDWDKAPTKALTERGAGLYEWFADGKVNTCWNAVDRHVENGRGDQVAIIYDSPITGRKAEITYAQLKERVSRFAGGLAARGIEKGDRVIIYMPMVPEALIAMLAVTRIGAIHSVVFGGFAAHELAVRIDDSRPKAILAASAGIEPGRVVPYKPLLDNAIAQAKTPPEFCVILQRDEKPADMIEGRDVDWADLEAAEPAACLPVEGNHPAYILYTSGTTGKPKGIVRDNGGHAVALRYSMEKIYGAKPGEVYWAASDVGWVVGHSYIVYAPLITGCTTILFEGKPVRTPDAGTFWRIIEEYKVSVFFTAPTAFRAIKKEDPRAEFLKKYDVSSLKALFLAGERLDPPTYHWLKDNLGKLPVIDHWWQTESGWPIVANPFGMELKEVRPGSATLPVPGYDVQILNARGEQQEANEEGSVVVKLPLPPGCLPTLWQDPDRFQGSYMRAFPGYYLSGDGGYKDQDGYVFIMGRIDDVINVAGHRLSTGEMEEIIGAHPAVAECSVFGIHDELRGQVPVGLVVLKDGVDTDNEIIEKELVEMVRNAIGAVAYFRRAAVVKRLPKTRSGKILRHILRKLADGTRYDLPSTIDDPNILQEIKDVMAEQQIGDAFQN